LLGPGWVVSVGRNPHTCARLIAWLRNG
jgi:hypothetical protein